MNPTATANVTDDAADRAAGHLYDAECALHAARQSGIDAWIAAAADQLHQAVVELDAVVLTRR